MQIFHINLVKDSGTNMILPLVILTLPTVNTGFTRYSVPRFVQTFYWECPNSNKGRLAWVPYNGWKFHTPGASSFATIRYRLYTYHRPCWTTIYKPMMPRIQAGAKNNQQKVIVWGCTLRSPFSVAGLSGLISYKTTTHLYPSRSFINHVVWIHRILRVRNERAAHHTA